MTTTFTKELDALLLQYDLRRTFQQITLSTEEMATILTRAAQRLRTTPRPCTVCGGIMHIGKGHAPKNKTICSNRCKIHVFRQRHGLLKTEAPR